MFYLAPFDGHSEAGNTMDFVIENTFGGEDGKTYSVYGGNYEKAKWDELGEYVMTDGKLTGGGLNYLATIVVTEKTE